MTALSLFVVAAAVAMVGLVGVLAPVLPGLLLVWLATAGSLLLRPGGTPVWAVALLTVLALGGTAMSYLLPARRAVAGGAPRASLVVAVVGAVVGFVVIPVLGLLVGAVGGLVLAEYRRTGDVSTAWASTRDVLLGYGLGVFAELLAGMVMVSLWVAVWVGTG